MSQPPYRDLHPGDGLQTAQHPGRDEAGYVLLENNSPLEPRPVVGPALTVALELE